MNFYGVNTSTAVKNMIIRKNEISRGKINSKKGIKSALIVQGGCMRGVFSAGSLIALEKLGFCQAFDAVYGSSSGAINAAYFLARQSAFGTSVYYEDINNLKFINLLRFNKIVDIDYLFDVVITYKKPLDIKRLTNSKTPLYFFVTDIDTSDGGICKTIPIDNVINDGFTDILVILTETIKSKKDISLLEKFLIKKSLSKFNQNLFDAYLTGLNNYNYWFDVCIGKIKTKKKVNIATIVPDNSFKLNRLTKDENLLKNAAVDGAKKVFDLFNQKGDINNILKYN